MFILSSPRAERARAVTVSKCPHCEVGQDFLLRRRVTLTETAGTRKRKVEKSIRRCQIDRLCEGYKRAIDEIRGPIAKNGFLGHQWPNKAFLVINGPFWGRFYTAGCTFLTRFASRVVLQHVFQCVPPFVQLVLAIWGLRNLQWPKKAFMAINGPFLVPKQVKVDVRKVEHQPAPSD